MSLTISPWVARRIQLMRWLPEQDLTTALARLHQVLLGPSKVMRRDAMAVLLGLHGLRSIEIVRLEKADRRPGGLWVRTAKRGRPRMVPLQLSVEAQLDRVAAEWPGPLLLPSARGHQLDTRHLRRVWRRWSTAWGIQIRFHGLRHTAGMRTYAATQDPLLVQQLLGHSTLSMILVYAASQGSARECMPDLPPPLAATP